MQVNIAGYSARLRSAANPLNITSKNGWQNRAGNTGTGSMYGAQCKVTISKEGKKLSQQAKQPVQSIQAAKVDRILIRAQEQKESYQEEYSKKLDEITSLINSVKNNYTAGEDKETIEKKQDALNKMMEQRELQKEENKKALKDAAGALSMSAKQQDKIDKANADLYVMLKSFEDEEESEEGGDKEHSGSSENDGGEEAGRGAIGTQIQKSAADLGVSAARRELFVNGLIDGIDDEGLSLLAEADALMNDIYTDIDGALEAMNDDSLSEEDKKQLAADYTDRAMAKTAGSMEDIMRLRRKGLQMRQDARELDTKHIVVNPLDNVGSTQKAIMNAGVDAAFLEASQGALDDASQDLADRVQDEIDKRNDISEPSKEEQEEETRAEELKQEELEKEKTEQEELEEKIEIEKAEKNTAKKEKTEIDKTEIDKTESGSLTGNIVIEDDPVA